MAHLHPINLIGDYEFETCLPSMDKGEYVLYADLLMKVDIVTQLSDI